MEIMTGAYPDSYTLFTHLVNLAESELIGYDLFALVLEGGDEWAGFAIMSRVGRESHPLVWITIDDAGEDSALVEMWRWWRKHEDEYRFG